MTWLITRLWCWVVLVVAVTSYEYVAARESRKEPNLMPVPIGVNLLGEPGHRQDTQGYQSHGDITHQLNHNSENSDDVKIDYDYFMFGLQQSESQESLLHRPSTQQPPPSKNRPDIPSVNYDNQYDIHNVQDYSYYNYEDDDLPYHHHLPHENSNGQHPGTHDHHDPFSVFYDSLFPMMDEMDTVEVAKPSAVEALSRSPQPQPSSTTTESTPPSYYALPTVTVKQPISAPVEKPSRKTPAPPASHPQYIPRHNHSVSHQHQKLSKTKPISHPLPSSKNTSASVSKPMDLSHLKVLMPKILEKFGLPESFGDNLFKDEVALQDTLLQIMRDRTFRDALSMIPKLDLLNMDMKSLLSTVSSIDPTVIMNVLKNADLSRVASLMSNLGIDTSYISGVFNRAGAAANYSPKDGDDDSKLIYIPILDTGSVNNVQVFGFIVIMFFLLTTAYAYLEYGLFTTARKDGPLNPSITSEQILGWGETSDIWLPAVDAVEEKRPWNLPQNPPPPIHVMRPSPPETPIPEWVGVRPNHPNRPSRPYAPIRRPRPNTRRRYYPRYRPKNQGHLLLNSQEIRGLTRRRPVYRPIDRIDRTYYDSYDDYYDDSDYYYYDDEEYDHISERTHHENGEAPRAGAINYHYYPATARPYDHPYSYYSFPGPRVTAETHAPTTTPKSTSESASPTTTTNLPTRPTSRYADTIKTGQPPHNSQ